MSKKQKSTDKKKINRKINQKAAQIAGRIKRIEVDEERQQEMEIRYCQQLLAASRIIWALAHQFGDENSTVVITMKNMETAHTINGELETDLREDGSFSVQAVLHDKTIDEVGVVNEEEVSRLLKDDPKMGPIIEAALAKDPKANKGKE